MVDISYLIKKSSWDKFISAARRAAHNLSGSQAGSDIPDFIFKKIYKNLGRHNLQNMSIQDMYHTAYGILKKFNAKGNIDDAIRSFLGEAPSVLDTPLAKRLVTPINLLIGGAGIAGSTAAIEAIKNKFYYNRMLNAYPEFKGNFGKYPEPQVERLYHSIRRLDPNIVKDPVTSGSAVKQLINQDVGVPIETYVQVRKLVGNQPSSTNKALIKTKEITDIASNIKRLLNR